MCVAPSGYTVASPRDCSSRCSSLQMAAIVMWSSVYNILAPPEDWLRGYVRPLDQFGIDQKYVNAPMVNYVEPPEEFSDALDDEFDDGWEGGSGSLSVGGSLLPPHLRGPPASIYTSAGPQHASDTGPAPLPYAALQPPVISPRRSSAPPAVASGGVVTTGGGAAASPLLQGGGLRGGDILYPTVSPAEGGGGYLDDEGSVRGGEGSVRGGRYRTHSGPGSEGGSVRGGGMYLAASGEGSVREGSVRGGRNHFRPRSKLARTTLKGMRRASVAVLVHAPNRVSEGVSGRVNE